MSLSRIKQQGFTIVELLIVVVVIGILAAIVIVAYNGVTNSAKNSGYLSDAQNLAKIAEVVNANTGAYPTGADTTALTTSFNSTATSKIASNVAITLVTAAPTNAAALTAADGSPKTYSVDICTAGAGLRIYYPDTGGTIRSIMAGAVSGSC